MPATPWNPVPARLVETRDAMHGEEVFQALEAEGYQPAWIDTATTME